MNIIEIGPEREKWIKTSLNMMSIGKGFIRPW